jgi:hypothetical protein
LRSNSGPYMKICVDVAGNDLIVDRDAQEI